MQCNPLGAERVLPPSEAAVNLNVLLRIMEDLGSIKLYGTRDDCGNVSRTLTLIHRNNLEERIYKLK